MIHCCTNRLPRKRQYLRRVLPAFVQRDNSSLEEPSAAEFLLGEMCAHARARQQRRTDTTTRSATSAAAKEAMTGMTVPSWHACML